MDTILKAVLAMPRNIKRLVMLLSDLCLVPFALWASFSLRLGQLYLPEENVLFLFIAAPIIAIPIFIRFGLYRAIIRYIGSLAFWTVVKAVSFYTLVWGVIVLLSGVGMQGVPRSVLLINWLVTLLLLGGGRALARWLLTRHMNLEITSTQPKKVAIYGAGAAGIQIATALSGSPDFNPVAFIDDNRSL